GWGARGGKLCSAGVGGLDPLEAAPQDRGERARAAAGIPGATSPRRTLGEGLGHRPRIGGPVGGVALRASREMVLEGAQSVSSQVSATRPSPNSVLGTADTRR